MDHVLLELTPFDDAIVPPQAEKAFEGGSDDVPKPVDGQSISLAEGRSKDEL